MTGHRRRCGKRRFASSADAQAEAERLGYRAYPCVRCGGWHLTSDGTEKVRVLSPQEQAILIVARDNGAEVDERGDCYDDEGRFVAPREAVDSLRRRGMISVRSWGEIVPRKR